MNGTVFSNGHATNGEEEGKDRDVFNAGSISEIRAALSELQKKEATVTSQLDALIASQKELQRELGRLDIFRANLSTQASKTRAIRNGMLSTASTSATRISSSVKRLDLEQSRVKATLTVVEQVRELKACVLGVSGSMGAPRDWETAAGYLSRASKLPKEVVDGEFAARVVPTAEVPDSPRVTLENASESLCALFLREFDQAVKENDGTKITRFFKLFPLINRSEIGLDVYGRYVCQGVAARARSNLNAGSGGNQTKDGFFYANALTKLFEHIAQIIDGHGGLVERHYGPGKMTRVIERLQVEADLQGGIIIDTWSDERRVERQLTDIRSYAYTFLVQSFLPVQRGPAGTPGRGSPAPQRVSEDDSVDMREIDGLLNEMTNMLGKWALYTRFVSEKCTPDDGDDHSSNADMPAFLSNSTLMKKIEERLLLPFNAMTTFFFRRSIEKAFQLDEQPPDLTLNLQKSLGSNPPHVTSAIEDIIYILTKVLQQSLATSQKAVITSVIPTLSRVMGSDFLGMEQRKMRDEHYPRSTVQGTLPPEHTIVAFLVLINNLDIAKNWVNQMIRSRLNEEPDAGTGVNTNTVTQSRLGDLFPLSGDADLVASILKNFAATFHEKTTELLTDGIAVIFNKVMKPRLRPILLDAFRDTDYTVSTEELVAQAQELGDYDDSPASINDAVRMRFQHGWDALTRPIARLMTESTFDNLLTAVVTYMAQLLEKRLWTYQGRVNHAGASRLEHDVNGIIKVIITGNKYAYREAFLKCAQICMIINMDDEEWEEIEVSEQQGNDIADKLKTEERARARAMLVAT